MRLRTGLAVLLLVATAAILALVATDALRWRDAFGSGDRAFATNPSTATWSPSTTLPWDPAGRLLGVGVPLRLRAAEQGFAAVQAAGKGYDNGLAESHARGLVEAELAALGRGGNRVAASTADNLLGILAYSDATGSGPVAPAPVDQAVADFQAAVRLDPTNEHAKRNLELLLHTLLAHGVRHGSNNSPGGATRGHRGAGGGIPGRGY